MPRSSAVYIANSSGNSSCARATTRCRPKVVSPIKLHSPRLPARPGFLPSSPMSGSRRRFGDVVRRDTPGPESSRERRIIDDEIIPGKQTQVRPTTAVSVLLEDENPPPSEKLRCLLSRVSRIPNFPATRKTGKTSKAREEERESARHLWEFDLPSHAFSHFAYFSVPLTAADTENFTRGLKCARAGITTPVYYQSFLYLRDSAQFSGFLHKYLM